MDVVSWALAGMLIVCAREACAGMFGVVSAWLLLGIGCLVMVCARHGRLAWAGLGLDCACSVLNIVELVQGWFVHGLFWVWSVLLMGCAGHGVG